MAERYTVYERRGVDAVMTREGNRDALPSPYVVAPSANSNRTAKALRSKVGADESQQ